MSYIGNEPRFTQFPSKFFDGDGSAMTVSLDYAPPNKAALLVFISGVRQDTDAYTLSGTSLTFTGTVESGTNNVQVVHLGLTVQVPAPADDTITTAKIQDDAVTAAKILADAVTTVKILDDNVTADKLANSINTDIAANTAKVTNATHTGDVTGATALTIAADAVTTAKIADDSVTAAKLADSAYLANRNIFINGACKVNQRGNSTGQTGSAYHSVDRFYTAISAIGTYSFSQASDGPDGFANSWKIDCTTADASPAAGDLLVLQCKFEGQNLQQLKKGTSDAESTTLSFWVKSYQTGNYQVNLFDNNNQRQIGATYTISSSETWEYKTITFAGDTTGALTDDANTSLWIEFWFDSGTDFSSGTVSSTWVARSDPNRNGSSTISLADSTSNYCQLTGIQFEIGTVATTFEHKTFAQDLQACQRYFNIPQNWWAHSDGSTATSWKFFHDFSVEMRATPALAAVGTPTVNKMNANAAGPNSITTPGTANKYGFVLSFTIMATGTGSAAATNTPYMGYAGFTADAEL